MSLLQRQTMVKGFPALSDHISYCTSCIMGKHIGDSFASASNKAKEQLELVHTYLCGPMQEKLVPGSLYFLTFIHDFSRKIWVYFIKYKYETFSKFKQFKVEAKKQSGKFIKVLRSDK